MGRKTDKRIASGTISFFVLAAVATAHAATGDDILGFWYNEERDGVVEVFKCAEKYCGRIAWAEEPDYPEGDTMGRAGQPRLDDNNPEPSLRNRPIIGLQIMDGFAFDGESGWSGGKVYDPKNGRTYSGKITLVSPNMLRLRGYVFLSFLGRTTTWTRLDK